jgi:hypothetical protein
MGLARRRRARRALYLAALLGTLIGLAVAAVFGWLALRF